MAKILILYHFESITKSKRNLLVNYYESLSSELVKCGNEVLLLNTLSVKHLSYGTCFSRYIEDYLTDEVKKFSPDLILTFNNQITDNIIKITNCPICCVEADTAAYFQNKEFILQNSQRYFLINFYDNFYNDEYAKLGFDKNKIFTLNQATSIKREDLEKLNNISFIGTNFYSLPPGYNFSNLDKKQFIKCLQEFNKNNYENYNDFENCCNNATGNLLQSYSMIDNRVHVLNAIWDLGLKLYGARWDKLSNENLILKFLFDETPKYTLKDNQDVYNSSVVNLSISHPQCKGFAFPWRCYDIMASSGILISSYSENLKNKTKDYVKIPMFNSPQEARELCKYALANPNYVKDITSASNEFIEKEGRWINNFKIMEEKLNIKLLHNRPNEKGYDILVVPYEVRNKTRKKSHIDMALKFLLSELPVINVLYPKQKRKKIYERIGALQDDKFSGS